MKKLTLTSNEEDTFILDSRRIINTELTLIVSNPNHDTFIELIFGQSLDIKSSVIKIVKKDGSLYRSPIYFDGDASITNSEIKGAIRFDRGFVADCKIEGEVEFG